MDGWVGSRACLPTCPLRSLLFLSSSPALCFRERFSQIVESSQGWEWVDETAGQFVDGRPKHKWGWVTRTQGAALNLKVS
jgi:hypothetical protein